MKRRRILIFMSAGLSIPGCLAVDQTGDGSATATPATGDTSFSIGALVEGVHAHRLTVQNAGDTSRLIELRIRNTEVDETRLARSIRLTGGGKLSGELRRPAEYEVRVTLPNLGEAHVTTVDYFDTCNEYETIVAITPDGMLTSETLTTDLECPPQ